MPGISEKFKKLCKNKGIQVHYKGTNTLRILFGNPKDKDPKNKSNGHHIPLQVPPNKLPQCMYRRIRQILGRKGQGTFQSPLPHPPYTVPLQDILWTQNSSTYYTKMLTTIPGPLRRPCSSMSRTLPSTETWESTNFHTYGTIFYRHLLHYSANLPCPLPHPPTCPTGPPPAAHIGRGHILFLVGIHARSNTTSNTPKTPQKSQKLHPLQQHHLGKFLNFYMLV